MIQQDDMRKAIQVSQPLGILGQDLNATPDPGAPLGLDRHSLNLFEGTIDDTNRLIADHPSPSHMS
jgi:hypothetical protein